MGSRLRLLVMVEFRSDCSAALGIEGVAVFVCIWQADHVVKEGILPGMMEGRSCLLFLVIVAK